MPPADAAGPARPDGSGASGAPDEPAEPTGPDEPDEEDTVDLDLDDLSDVLHLMPPPGGPRARAAVATGAAGAPGGRSARFDGSSGDLLDELPGWGSVATGRGTFQLLPAVPARDLPLITRWMNDPAVAAFWGLAGPEQTTDRHLRAQLDGDGRSTPCLGVLDGRPMSYWEIYRADLDPLARYYPARPHDTGIHLLIGRVADRGHGIGGVLLRAVADHILDRRPSCSRVVAEPDLRNTASVAAFLTAGFRYCAELELPAKRAALMVRERRLTRSL